MCFGLPNGGVDWLLGCLSFWQFTECRLYLMRGVRVRGWCGMRVCAAGVRLCCWLEKIRDARLGYKGYELCYNNFILFF